MTLRGTFVVWLRRWRGGGEVEHPSTAGWYYRPDQPGSFLHWWDGEDWTGEVIPDIR